MFDSGGYAVQTGRLDYFEMYSRLLTVYRRERWAGLYTLPDVDAPGAAAGCVLVRTEPADDEASPEGALVACA
ncbi:MAG: hypothetical protein AB7R89_31350 [Dehalococcoidia bacterium]